MNGIAIITARGGSKRIPKKNIRKFCGKPIIQYSIEAALKSKLFEEVMVSTDDVEIAKISKSFGAKVPFLRSGKTSDDFASTADVLLEVLKHYKENGNTFEYSCCLYPTAPFVTAKKLIDAFDLLKKRKFSCVFPVLQFSYPIQRALQITNGKASMISPKNMNKRSQGLKPTYHDCGQFYFFHTKPFLTEKKLLMSNSGAIIVNEMEAQDIDNEADWKLAEIKFELIHPKHRKH